MSNLRGLQMFTALIFVILSVGMILSWYTLDLFPWLHIASFLSLVAVVARNYLSKLSAPQFYWSVLMVSITGVAFRTPLILLPGSLSGNDSEKFALFAQFTLDSGSYRLPSSSFYGVAGGFHTYIAQTAAISGISTEDAMVVVGVLIGIIGPLLAISYCFLVIGSGQHGYTAGIIAGVIAAVAILSVRVSYMPIAQSVGTVLLLTYVLAVLRHINLDPADRMFNWPLLIVILLAMAFSHKLPVLIASVLVVGGWLTTRITTVDLLWSERPSQAHIPLALALMTVLGAVLQQTIITSYISRAIDHTATSAAASTQVPTRVGDHPAAATTVDVGILLPFQSHSYLPLTLAVAGLAWIAVVWLIVIRPSRDDIAVPLVFLLSIASLTSFVLMAVGGGMVGGGPNPGRLQVLQEPLLGALIGIGYVATQYSMLRSEPHRSYFKRIFFVILLILLIFHAFSVVGSPDYPGEPREYLTEGEITGKNFADNHVETSIATDDRMQRETPNRAEVTNKHSPWAQLGTQPDTRFTRQDFEFLQGTVTESGFETILYRPNIQTYRGGFPFKDYRYEIAWDVEQSADKTYHRTYDNDHAVIYRNGS